MLYTCDYCGKETDTVLDTRINNDYCCYDCYEEVCEICELPISEGTSAANMGRCIICEMNHEDYEEEGL